jgi:hypothetical protein
MKWLERIFIALGVIIVINIGINALIEHTLTDKAISSFNESIQLGYNHGYTTGYQTGITVGYHDGRNKGYREISEGDPSEVYTPQAPNKTEEVSVKNIVSNPTYAELQAFLASEETISVWETNNNAELQGIRAGHAIYETAYLATKGKCYELVAFATLDKGLILIELPSYKEVQLEIGKHYHELNGLPATDYDDKITKIRIFW